MMSCRISLQIELGEFLAEPRAQAFADFRAHYPRCPECAAEVRAWTELQERLAAAHPDPERLARYPQLPVEQRAVLDRHVAGCPSCREELAQLASFDPSRLAAAHPAPEGSPLAGLREALAALGRLLWHPAFAYLLAAALLVPALQRGGLPDLPSPRTETSSSDLLDEAAAPSAPSREFAAANRARPAADSSLVERFERRAVSEKQLARAPEEQARQAARPPRDEAVRRQAPGLGEHEALAPRAEAPAPRPLTGAESDVADALGSLAAAEPAPLKKKDAGKAGRTDATSPLRSLARAPLAEAKLSEAAPGEGGAVLHLVAGRHVETALPGRRDLELRVPLPQGVPGGGEARLRLVDASGRRELRERVPVATGSGDGPPELAWRVPGSWLAIGSYRLELMLPGAAAPLHFSFAVGGG